MRASPAPTPTLTEMLDSPRPPSPPPAQRGPWDRLTCPVHSSSLGPPGACVLGSLGGRLGWGRGPVSRLGLECHKELLRAHDFLLNQAPRRPSLGQAPCQGLRGSAWPASHLKALLCVVCLLRVPAQPRIWARPIPLPALSLLPGGSGSSRRGRRAGGREMVNVVAQATAALGDPDLPSSPRAQQDLAR